MRTLFLFSLGLAALLAFLTGCDSTEAADPTLYGTTVALGDGTARTYVERDADGAATALGVALSAEALTGLPGHADPAHEMMTLTLPDAVRGTLPFDHVMLGWNPHGHEPEGLFTFPHFDFHFYTAPVAEVMTWTPADPQFVEKGHRFPDARYLPAPFIPDPSGAVIPMMGTHWLDASDPTYAPGGPTFGEVLLWGSYDGEVVFTEPMITKAFLEGLRTSGATHEEALAQPQAYATAGRYPTRYTVRYDAERAEYRIELGGLTARTAG